MTRALGVALALAAVAFAAQAVPFWGAKTSMPVDTDPAKLEPGEFIWAGDAIPSGPIVVLVSLIEQRAEVYRNGVRIGVSTASTGKPGHRTPTGVFTVLQKDADHHSKTYNNAAMPYTERLTWDGVALHAGGLPGYPSSHGCVHLPSEFARLLFAISRTGMTVVIADDRSAPSEVAHPAALAPVDPTTGQPDVEPRLAASEGERWEPDKSPVGALAIVISAADRRAIVLRNGVEIGRAKVTIDEPAKPFGTHALVMLEGAREGRSPLDPRARAPLAGRRPAGARGNRRAAAARRRAHPPAAGFRGRALRRARAGRDAARDRRAGARGDDRRAARDRERGSGLSVPARVAPERARARARPGARDPART